MNKITLINNVKIKNNKDEIIVSKKSDKDILYLFNYLNSRNFNSIPKILDYHDKVYNYEFVNELHMPKEQKARDIIKLISILHTKTTYYKEVGKDKYKTIYEELYDNIYYIEEYYNNLISNFEKEEFMSPSKYLIARNFNIINSSINFSKNELESWKDLVADKTKQRVCVVHNNLKTNHYLKNSDSYIISWDNYLVDTPILDLYKFYKNEALDFDFEELLKEYNKNYTLLDDEKKLLFILLSIPEKIKFVNNELINTKNTRLFLDYIYKTNNLITPYYLEDNKEK